jgi:hypothetical protein
MTAERVPIFEVQWILWAFPLLWVFVTAMLGLMSGWARLSRAFSRKAQVEGERFRFASGSMGWANVPVRYTNCLFITVNAEGFRLSILFPFRLMSPPLFIPWSSVVAAEEKGAFIFTYYQLRLRDHRQVISVSGSAGRAIKQAHGAFNASGSKT